MCGVLIGLVVLVAITISVLHVSAGVAWVIVIIGVVGAAALYAIYGNPQTRRVGKMGLVYSNVCPACRKHNKSGAKICRYCRTPLVVPVEPKASKPMKAPKLGAGDSLTPGGYVRRADGVVVVPPDAKVLYDSWRAAGSIAGLTMPEIVQRVGRNADAVPAVAFTNGYTHTWSSPGYTISVLFGPDNHAIGIQNASQQLG